MEKRSHAGGGRESYFPSWLLVSTWGVVGPPRSRAERGAGFRPPQGQLARTLWQCRHHGLGSSVKSVLGALAGAVPAHRYPHPHPCLSSAQIAEKLIKAFAEQIFYTGFIHSDPHPGNGKESPRAGGGVLAWGRWQSLRASWAQERKDT